MKRFSRWLILGLALTLGAQDSPFYPPDPFEDEQAPMCGSWWCPSPEPIDWPQCPNPEDYAPGC